VLRLHVLKTGELGKRTVHEIRGCWLTIIEVPPSPCLRKDM
jgi:hypothetical protein